MMLADLVIDRLKEKVDSFVGRVEGVMDLSAMISTKRLPTNAPAAWVIWLGDNADASGTATFLRQAVDETVAVIVIDRVAGDLVGSKVQGKLDALREDVKRHLVGWQFDPEAYPLEYRRGRFVGLVQSFALLQLDFACRSYIRQQHQE